MHQTAGNHFYVRERLGSASPGRFRRDIGLPEGVEDDRIEAALSDGVLQVTVRDCAKSSDPARIPIRT